MKDKDIFEKARMRTVIIPIAGFITAAATVLLVIFSAAYFGAFNVMKETTATRAPEFDPPEEPDMDRPLQGEAKKRDRHESPRRPRQMRYV